MPNIIHLPLCPFYKRNGHASISCEDVFRTFDSETDKELWMFTHCDTWDWQSCHYAVDLYEAYENYEKGDEMALLKNENQALKTELKGMAIKLGRMEKKSEAIYQKYREAKDTLAEYEAKVDGQVKAIASVYEQRLAYVIEAFAPGKKLYEAEIKEWAGDKAFAIILQEDDYGPYWKVVFKEDETKTED